MAGALADVPAPQREPTGLTTVWSLGVAVSLGLFLTTDASLRSWLEAGRAAAQVALERAAVTAREGRWARPSAGWLLLAALDRRVQLCSTARTVQGLSRVDAAGLAEAQVAEVVAGVLSTAEGLVADLETDVVSFRVSAALLDRTANLLALVSAAGLQLVAESRAPEVG